MAISLKERLVALERGKTQAKVVSETIGDTTRVKNAIFVGKVAMDRVDVIVIVYSNEAAESCVA